MNKTDSKRLKEVWALKEDAYREVSRCATIEDMILKRIKICNKVTQNSILKKINK